MLPEALFNLIVGLFGMDANSPVVRIVSIIALIAFLLWAWNFIRAQWGKSGIQNLLISAYSKLIKNKRSKNDILIVPSPKSGSATNLLKEK